MMKLLSIAALSLMLAGGVAMAQTGTSTDPAAAGQPDNTSGADVATGAGPKYLTDPARMGAFYTDDTMSTVRPAAEVEAAWTAMSAEDQAAVRAECEANDSDKYRAFCGAINDM